MKHVINPFTGNRGYTCAEALVQQARVRPPA